MSIERKLEILKARIDDLLTRNPSLVVAIDGQCTSGKTTLAGKLAEIYDCNLIHLDDFFLRPEQRTEERFAQVGGNVDYERFREEVLEPLAAGGEFAYRPFSCSTFTLTQPVTVPVKGLTIVEGSYSLHPYFGEPYGLKVLLTVDPETQRQRILERPAFLHSRFFEQWIPMENRYFEEFRIEERADLIL